jgi:hypothetical protein
MEFRQLDGVWLSESGATVEIAAAMPATAWQEADETREPVRRLGSTSGQLRHARAN